MRKDKDFIQLFFLYNSERCELKMQHHPFPSGIPLYNYYIAIFPLPHVFGLRRLQSNPPRSLWLQHIHRMCCLTLPIPPFILIGCGCPTHIVILSMSSEATCLQGNADINVATAFFKGENRRFLCTSIVVASNVVKNPA